MSPPNLSKILSMAVNPLASHPDQVVLTSRAKAGLEFDLRDGSMRCISANTLNGSVTLPNIARNKSPGTSGSGSRRSDEFTPCLQGRCPEGSVRSCLGEMALDVEGILCCCMH